MHRESPFQKILHVLTVAFTTSVLFLWLNTAAMQLDGMTRLSTVEQLQQWIAQIIGALLGLLMGVLSWNHIIRKHPDWDERIIAVGCLVFLLVFPVAVEAFRSLGLF
ncbi:hypothetical protein [Gimesia sp.]|uniref:hypothetical protein n=1 Tax=Gimesia sp. TaxID=2024833 RepID=UPI003A901374